jgi:hypothetical protein
MFENFIVGASHAAARSLIGHSRPGRSGIASVPDGRHGRSSGQGNDNPQVQRPVRMTPRRRLRWCLIPTPVGLIYDRQSDDH